jgi:hypothetical protein
MKKNLYIFIVLCAFLSAFSMKVSAQVINELDINPPATDQPCEYIELRGTPGAALTNLYFAAIEGDGIPSGTADYVASLGTQTFGSNGLLVITGTMACGARTYPAATTRVQDPVLDTGTSGLENGTISFLLISSPTALVTGTDYDADNNGTLELLPANATIIDAVGWSDAGAGDLVYGGVTLTTAGVIDAAVRFPDNTTPLSAAAWYAGDLMGATNDSTAFAATNQTANFPANGALTPGAPNVGTAPAPGDANVDFDGDRKSDYVVTRDSGGAKTWYININGGAFTGVGFGAAGDFPVPEDYDGDGKDDVAVWREGATSAFYILQSQTNTVRSAAFGTTGDDPRVVSDYDGDNKADIAVYRKSAGQNFYYYISSLTGNLVTAPWGGGTTTRPNVGDYDGDNKADFCIHYDGGSGAGVFALQKSSGGNEFITFGLISDKLAPGDYDGDGKSDFTVVRNVSGTWAWYTFTRTNQNQGVAFGSSTDILAPGDYDGDGKQDVGVWRPGSPSAFYSFRSTNSTLNAFGFGTATDFPAANWYTH